MEIAVIDDEESIRRVVRDALEDAGHTVTTYDTCHKALQDLNDPDFPHPQVIILDVMMPKLDGYSFHNMLQENERTRRIPLIIMTAKSRLDETFVQSSNVFAFLEKPFDMNDLCRKVAKTLARTS